MTWMELDPPPANSMCLPTLYNKLDAEVIGRTRALNTILDMRYQFQHRMLAKHYRRMVTVFNREKERNLQHLQKVRTRLPYMAQLPEEMHVQDKVKFFRVAQDYMRRTPMKRKQMAVQVSPINPRHTPLAEKIEKPFCDRYFVHHYAAEVKGRGNPKSKCSRRMTEANIGIQNTNFADIAEVEPSGMETRRRSVKFDLPTVKGMGLAKNLGEKEKPKRRSRRKSKVTESQGPTPEVDDSRRASVNSVMLQLRRSSIEYRRASIASLTPESRPASVLPDSRGVSVMSTDSRRASVVPGRRSSFASPLIG